MPTNGLPGMTSTMRTLTTDRERARSFAKLVILLTFTPAAGSNSKHVTTGPGQHGLDLRFHLEVLEFFYQA